MNTPFKELMIKGKDQGFLLESDILACIEGVMEKEQFEEICQMIEDLGVKVQRQNEK